jgi:beta-lactamase regulating signal transducer with metallopeptidase domain
VIGIYLLAFAVCQIGLLPLTLVYLRVVPLGAGVRFQWALHRALLLRTCLLPCVPTLAASAMPMWLRPSPSGAPNVAGVLSLAARARPSGTPAAVATSRFLRVLWAALCTATPAGVALLCFRVSRNRRWVRDLMTIGRCRRIGRLRVILSEGPGIPASFGIAQPSLVLRKNVPMSPADRAIVFAHEGHHLRRGHAYWSALETTLSALFWYAPLPELLRRRGAQIHEFLCDQIVGPRFGPRRYPTPPAHRSVVDKVEVQLHDGVDRRRLPSFQSSSALGH